MGNISCPYRRTAEWVYRDMGGWRVFGQNRPLTRVDNRSTTLTSDEITSSTYGEGRWWSLHKSLGRGAILCSTCLHMWILGNYWIIYLHQILPLAGTIPRDFKSGPRGDGSVKPWMTDVGRLLSYVDDNFTPPLLVRQSFRNVWRAYTCHSTSTIWGKWKHILYEWKIASNWVQ